MGSHLAESWYCWEFSVLGFSDVTNTGTTSLSGDLGVWSGSSITGGGTINVGGATHTTDSVAQQAQADAGTADGSLTGQANTGGSLGALDSLVLVPGVYDLGEGSLGGGVLTLDGAGVYIFRTSSTLVTAGSVSLINGARACEVFWHVEDAATINGTSFVGTVIAKTGIHFGTGVSLDGRALAIGADVTLQGNTISGPSCDNPTSTTSNSSASSTSGEDVCVAPEITAVTPIIIESKRVSPTSIFLSWGPYSGLDTFNVRYGLENGTWLYNTNVTGFNATINDLPANQPMWFQVAARNNCAIGTYGEAKQIGGRVLGASTTTLAATGSYDQVARCFLAVTAALVVFFLGRALLRNNENS